MEGRKNNYLIIASLSTALFLGGVGGYYTFYRLGPIGNLCELKYISHEEIIGLEKKRIQAEAVDLQESTGRGKNLFYGRSGEVTEIISRIAHGRKGNKTKVILTSGPIRGNNIESMSEEVHRKITADLARRIDTGKGSKP